MPQNFYLKRRISTPSKHFFTQIKAYDCITTLMKLLPADGPQELLLPTMRCKLLTYQTILLEINRSIGKELRHSPGYMKKTITLL
jgi:hypothetical protein